MSIIKKAHMSEKSVKSNDKGLYVFIVDKNANKIQIKDTVEKTYSVNVTSVRTLRYDGKDKTKYTKTALVRGRKPSYKKAFVQVAQGEVIDVYDM